MIDILLIYIIYIVATLTISYYINIFMDKEQISRTELKEILPYYKELWGKLLLDGSLSINAIIISLSSLFGAIQIYLFDNIIFGSFALIVAIYFAIPFLEKYSPTQNEIEQTNDNILTTIIENIYEIIIGYGFGISTLLIYKWALLGNISFWMLIINLIITTSIVVLSIIKKIKKIDINI